MNEKYIQAAILGSLIGGAIVLDDFIKPDYKQTNKKHMIIKSGSVGTEFKSIDDLKDLDVLDIDVLEELDLENLEDKDVQIKIIKSIDDLKDLDDLKDIDVLEELDLENLEDKDVQIKIIKTEILNE